MAESFDLTRRFVRVTGTLPQGLVEFEFAIGDPDVVVELVMPQAAFQEFCAANAVEFLPDPATLPETPPAFDPEGDPADFHWPLRDATSRRFR